MANTPIVRQISECFIRPRYEPEDAKNPVYLGPTDLVMLSAHYIQVGLLFAKPSSSPNQHNTMETLLDNLKHSLSLALIHFYPLAGQFETEVDEDQHTSLVFINCNKGPGSGFIHASLDMTISDILEPRYVPRVVQSFFDHNRTVNHDAHTRPLMSVKVTELVDGVFIGCSMNHACSDGISFCHFFNMWSEIFKANGDKIVISRPPIHDRWFVDGTGPKIKLPFTHPDEFISRYEAPELRERIFHFSAESIAKLKAKANADRYGANMTISSLQSLGALVWRSITRARRLHDDVETRCFLSIDNRIRLDPPLSNNHFANFIQAVEGRTKVGELLSKNLGFGASLLNQAIVEHNDEKVRNVAAYWMLSPFVYQIEYFYDPNSVLIGSSPRFDMYENEFGMGKALAVLSGHAGKIDGNVVPHKGREGGGSIDLLICLLPDSMEALESDEEFMKFLTS